MNRLLRHIFVLFIVGGVFGIVNAHTVLVSEVMANAAGTETVYEWIEVLNITSSPVCIDGWQVDDGFNDEGGSWTVPDPTGGDDYILYPGGYITFARDADSFAVRYGYEPDLATVPGSTGAIPLSVTGSLAMANTGDQAYLRNSSDSIIDCVAWGNKKGAAADSVWYPIAAAASLDGVSFVRDPQDSEGVELSGEVSEVLDSVFALAGAQTFVGPNTGGLNPSGATFIRDLIHDPVSPSETDIVQVSCIITAGIAVTDAKLIYTVNDFAVSDTSTMHVNNDTIYIDSIPQQGIGTRVKYYVFAVNADGDTVKSPINAPASYNQYIISDGSDFYEAHFNKTVDHTIAVNNFAQGEDSLDWHMAKYIGQATKTIDACLYDLDRQIVADSLISAHNRGVDVRFITDADNSANTQVIELETAGIPVIDDAFPISYGGSNIMHNKFLVIDTSIVFSGSYNVTDNGTTENANNSVIIKNILLAEAYTAEFTEMWGSHTMTPDANNSKFANSKTDNITHRYYLDNDTIEVYMSPTDGCASKMINAIGTADKSIYFCIFSFTRQDIADAMKARYDNNGVRVLGVFDATFWNADYSKSLDLRGDWNTDTDNNPWSPPTEVLRDAVDGNLLHHKYMLIDCDEWTSNPIVITGSYNWSAAAEDGNDENMLIIHSRYFADMFLQEFAERYHEAGGVLPSDSFIIDTDIEDIAISAYRKGKDVVISYNIINASLENVQLIYNDNIL